MATPPSVLKNWAIDSIFDTSVGPSGSAWHNEPNKVLPIALRVSQGYVPSQSLDAESLNYLFNAHGQWIDYLSQSFHTASVDISVIEDVLSDTNISSSADAWSFIGGSKSKTIFFSPFAGTGYASQIASGQNSWYAQLSKVATSIVAYARQHFDATMHLPSGSVVTRVRVAVQPGQARTSGNRMVLEYSESTGSITFPSFPVTPVYKNLLLDEDNGTVNSQFLDSGVLSIDIDNKDKYQWFTVIAGDTADSLRDDIFYWAITYDDPGPRNL